MNAPGIEARLARFGFLDLAAESILSGSFAADPPGLQQDHAMPHPGELKGRRDSGGSRSNDAYVRSEHGAGGDLSTIAKQRACPIRA
jgi:hypothetical protein